MSTVPEALPNRTLALEVALGEIIDAVAATETGGGWLRVAEALSKGRALLPASQKS